MAPKVSNVVGCHEWTKWRSCAHCAGDLAGDGKIQLSYRRERSRSDSNSA